MKTLLILSDYCSHDEIIESLLVKHVEIVKYSCKVWIKRVRQNDEYEQYIKNKYEDVSFGIPDVYDFCIHVTHYPTTCKDFPFLSWSPVVSSVKDFFIFHAIDGDQPDNVFYLTDLARKNIFVADVLPFSECKRIKTNTPTYIVQGEFSRRDPTLLLDLLSNTTHRDYIIKIIGKGAKITPELLPFKDKLVFKDSLSFVDYHREFLDCYGILPLVRFETHPQYYTNKLTSTINYARGYSLKCIIDEKLQSIYNLGNVEVYTDSIVKAFGKSLDDFAT